MFSSDDAAKYRCMMHELLVENRALNANLTGTQLRCTNLLEQVRAFRRGSSTGIAIGDVIEERQRADAIHGDARRHIEVPIGNDPAAYAAACSAHRANCDLGFASGEGTFALLLMEELYEVLAAESEADARTELVQLAGLCLKAIEVIDLRATK